MYPTIGPTIGIVIDLPLGVLLDLPFSAMMFDKCDTSGESCRRESGFDALALRAPGSRSSAHKNKLVCQSRIIACQFSEYGEYPGKLVFINVQKIRFLSNTVLPKWFPHMVRLLEYFGKSMYIHTAMYIYIYIYIEQGTIMQFTWFLPSRLRARGRLRPTMRKNSLSTRSLSRSSWLRNMAQPLLKSSIDLANAIILVFVLFSKKLMVRPKTCWDFAFFHFINDF